MHGNRHVGRVVLVLALFLSACGGKGDGELMASAKDYLQKKDPKAATIQLKNLLQKDPSSAEARYLLATALFDSDDATGAEIELRRALDLKHPEAAVAPLMAKVLLALREYKKLTDQYAGLELSDPQAAVALQVSVATAYAAQGAPDKARAAIGKALSIAPQSLPAQIAHARIKASVGDVDGALGVLDELLSKNPGSAEAWQLKGELLVAGKSNPAAAIEAYKKALAIRPDNAPAHASLITLYFVQQDQKAASQQFEAFKAAVPGHPLTRFYDAQMTFARGDYKLTRELLQELVRAVPDNASVLHIAGATELQLNSLAQAETYLSRAVQLQPNFVGARRLLAKVYLRSNQPAKALAALRPALEKPGVDAETLTVAGQASLLADDPKAANGYFGRAAAVGPNDTKARAALAMAQLSKGNADAAFSELQSIAAADKGVSADMALISARLGRREFDAAMKAIDVLEKKQPDSPIAADLRGRVHVMRKDAAAARRSFEKALSQDARYLPAITSLAALDFIDKKPEAAKARFENLLKVDPKNVQALLALAELKRRTGGSRDEVAKLLGDAVSANPADPQPRLLLIEHHVAGGDFKAALTAAQAGVATVPGDVELQDQLARALMSMGDINQAGSTFGRLAAQHAESHLGHLGLAEVNIANKDFTAAAKNAKRALELAPNSLPVQRTAIIVAMRQKRPQDAIAVTRLMQTQQADEALGFILEGEIEAEQQRWDLAAAAFRRATTKPNPAQAPARLHFALVQAKKTADAARFADSWSTEHPKDALFLLYLADAASAQGELALAEKRYLQVLKLQPENPLALNNVAWIMIKQKRPGAVALAERAVKAAPGRLALMDTLAFALSSENQHAKAIELEKKVIALAPEALTFRLTLAKIYLQSGDKNLARAELEALLKPGKDFIGREEAAQLFKSIGSS